LGIYIELGADVIKYLKFMILFFFFSFPVSAKDLTQFDFPFLLGDWYWFSPDQSESTSESEYKAINISFNSDYVFRVKLLARDGSIQQTSGTYELDDSTLILFDATGDTQHHQYALNHYQLGLRGTIFTKLLPYNLTGSWISNFIEGDDVGDNVTDIALILRSDFIFTIKIFGKEGRSITHDGVYILERDHLVLIYREGLQDSVFSLEEGLLTLTNIQFGMHAELERALP
jgi:hypothetical protein